MEASGICMNIMGNPVADTWVWQVGFVRHKVNCNAITKYNFVLQNICQDLQCR